VNENKEKAEVLVKKEKITKKELFEAMLNYQGRTIQESYDYFMNMTSRNIYGFIIKGNHIV
jgi:hypothetical protein